MVRKSSASRTPQEDCSSAKTTSSKNSYQVWGLKQIIMLSFGWGRPPSMRSGSTTLLCMVLFVTVRVDVVRMDNGCYGAKLKFMEYFILHVAQKEQTLLFFGN